jgi:hypothetical protein
MEDMMNRELLEKELESYPLSLTIAQVGDIIGLERQSVMALIDKKILECYFVNPESQRRRYRILKAHLIDHILRSQNGEQNDRK